MSDFLKPPVQKVDVSKITLSKPSCCGPEPKNVPCCGPSVVPSYKFDPPTSVGTVNSKSGSIPRVGTQWLVGDWLGAMKVRLGFGRMKYGIQPGLYAVGSPTEESPVLVSANYKLSFDHLRSRIGQTDAWILVIDTKAVNVWCAAGKGTFGTDEIVNRIKAARLDQVVSHRKVIVPQLGAPGVAGHLVKKATGFQVVFGPVEASDLPPFLSAGMKATGEMRTKQFPIQERAVLIPLEFVEALKLVLGLSVAFWVISGLSSSVDFLSGAISSGNLSVASLVAALIAGTVLFPIVLPYLPGRAFALKGLWLAVPGSLVVLYAGGLDWSSWSVRLEGASWLFMVSALVTYMTMNFTGATTYTNPSGVKKEMRVAVPLQIVGASLGLILWIGARFAAS